jgi:CO/xanthine dehydrogenase FAD-binding subunit
VAIRNAGTLGGSLAMADPAAEWPACCVALQATIVVASRTGARRVAATDFFKDLYTTALGAGELITAVEIPCAEQDERHVFLELVRRRGDYAIVGLAARARLKGKTLSGVQLVYLGVGVTPVAAKGARARPQTTPRSARRRARSMRISRRARTSTPRPRRSGTWRACWWRVRPRRSSAERSKGDGAWKTGLKPPSR